MNKTEIVVIDSGVALDHSIFRDKSIEAYYFNDVLVSDAAAPTDGHGTAVCGIISSECPDAHITSVRLPSNDGYYDELQLIRLLGYIRENIRADIINISMGLNICQYSSELYDICSDMEKSGTVIISAFDNSGCISYPAAFDNVIGVTTGYCCTGNKMFEFVDDSIVNIAAKGNIQRVPWTSPGYIFIGGNSFACAHVTAQAANFVSGGIRGKGDILREFEKISVRQHMGEHGKKTAGGLPFSIKRAALFPFNKEMHSLVRYSGMLDFEIASIYDSKFSGTVGSTAAHLMRDDKVPNIDIKSIEKIDWDDFDTLILGHTDELSSLINKKDLRDRLISDAEKYHKNIFSFDDLGRQGIGLSDRVYYPKVDGSDLPLFRFGMLYRISKPVVGVFGTSSRQGKFTLQLKMREILSAQGYSVGQIGSEPSALLYGMDYCFPMGYNSSVYTREFDTIRYLNYIIDDLCQKNKDIIIVGSQSGTLPYDTGNISQFTVPQYNFLMGTQPDCVVLCVNPYDETALIERTIGFIESAVDCKVVAVVVFPMALQDGWRGIYGAKEKLSEDKFSEIKNEYQDRFGHPVYMLGRDEDMVDLVDVVTDFFVEE